jgi:hypothetical protein
VTENWKAIAAEAWDPFPNWEGIAREWRNAPIPHAEPPRRREGAPESTVHAIGFALREQGLAALDRPFNRERLRELSAAQLGALILALTRLRQRYPKTIDANLLEALAKRLHK